MFIRIIWQTAEIEPLVTSNDIARRASSNPIRGMKYFLKSVRNMKSTRITGARVTLTTTVAFKLIFNVSILERQLCDKKRRAIIFIYKYTST